MISPTFLADLQRYMISKGYTVNNGGLNIAVLEGVNSDGTLNNDAPDRFNDLLIVWDSDGKQPRLLQRHVCTCEPGKYYTDYPLNPKGAARIAFGQYRAWRIGFHQNKRDHEALVQVDTVCVYRDENKDGKRTGDKLDCGLFGINIHHGYDTPIGGSIGRHSAGCTVIPSRANLRALLDLLKKSTAYQTSRNHVFTVTFIAGDDFTKWRNANK
jgi:hypothetical protein